MLVCHSTTLTCFFLHSMIDGHILDGGEQRSGPFISGSRGSTVTVNTGYDRIYLWPRVGPAAPVGPHYWMEESYKKQVGIYKPTNPFGCFFYLSSTFDL